MAAKKIDTKSSKAAKPVAGKPKKEGSGGTAKEKWSKEKVNDKLNNMIIFDKPTYDKRYKLIIPSVVSERLNIRSFLAKQALREWLSKGLIHLVSKQYQLELTVQAGLDQSITPNCSIQEQQRKIRMKLKKLKYLLVM